jgi:hypothetical protein
MHLSQYNLVYTRENYGQHFFQMPPAEYVSSGMPGVPAKTKTIQRDQRPISLDECFFYHQPASLFEVDPRIPESIRNAFSESKNCLNSNYLTGASACLRKGMYLLLKDQNIPDSTDGSNHYNETDFDIVDASSSRKFLKFDKRIDLLRENLAGIEKEWFDALTTLHSLTSLEVHENGWEDLTSPNLRFLMGVLEHVLHQIYVEPIEKKATHEKLKALKPKSK